jgi:hypothetical protein
MRRISKLRSTHPGIRVVDFKQSASGGSFAESLWLISVWYEEDAEPDASPDS